MLHQKKSRFSHHGNVLLSATAISTPFTMTTVVVTPESAVRTKRRLSLSVDAKRSRARSTSVKTAGGSAAAACDAAHPLNAATSSPVGQLHGMVRQPLRAGSGTSAAVTAAAAATTAATGGGGSVSPNFFGRGGKQQQQQQYQASSRFASISSTGSTITSDATGASPLSPPSAAATAAAAAVCSPPSAFNGGGGGGDSGSFASPPSVFAAGFVGPDGGSADRAGGNRSVGRARKKRGSAAMLSSDTDAATAASISSAVTGAVEAEKVRNYDEMSRIMLHCYNTQLKAAGTELDPMPWVQQAQRCEQFGHRATAAAIVTQALRNPPSREWFPEDWYALASKLTVEGTPFCCGPILDHLSVSASRSPAVWKAAMAFGWQLGNEAAFAQAVIKANAHCGSYKAVWMLPQMHAKVQSIIQKQPPQNTSTSAHGVQPNVFLDSAHLEWTLDNVHIVRQLLMEGIAYFPKEPKLWVALGELNGSTEGPAAAHATYVCGLNVVPNSGTLKRSVQIAAAALAAAGGGGSSSGNNA